VYVFGSSLAVVLRLRFGAMARVNHGTMKKLTNKGGLTILVRRLGSPAGYRSGRISAAKRSGPFL
jgi:hypothetical protein